MTGRSALRFKPDAQPEEPLEIWAVSDGRAGIENQVLGLAEAVARLVPARISRKHVRYKPAYDRLPTALKLAPRRFLADGVAVGPPWPDLWIAAGRATMPLSLRMRGWAGGETFVVQVQDPRWPAHFFDAVVPPRHDKVHGANVVEITGSPHRVTPKKLDTEYELFRDILDPLPHPRVAVLIGGRSKSFDLKPARAERLAAEIAAAVETERGSLLLTFSRRTPDAARSLLTDRLSHLPGVIWDGRPPNPYFAFLAAADYVLVTEDSTNMVTEAASTGAPLFILDMDGQSPKFRRFHEELERLDVARPFGGTLYRWEYPPLRETERAARELLDRMASKAAAKRSAG